MEITPATTDTKAFTNFTTFISPSGLTYKSTRVLNLQAFIKDINSLAQPVLSSINTELITDPATIVDPEYFINLKEIISQSIDYWKNINFPTMAYFYCRTTGWDSTFSFPNKTIPMDIGVDSILKELNIFLEKEKPQQIILHPRVSDEMASTEQISVRSQSIPESIKIEMGRGGQVHINKIEGTDQKYSFEPREEPKDLPLEFKEISKAIEVITPIADNFITKYSKLVTAGNLPVYEFKVVQRNGKYLINMFDYEVI